ncbi:hypothetical protein [Nocardia caishijiensis]|uniref:hypothetical protein n=1 Tax=Nocardia caishijiensis TaxID=184756 RepID=UPI0008328D72|nr:hypothetical protein [Nocardia caishijiensis]
MQVSGDQVVRHFGSTGAARRRLEKWKVLPNREYVAEKVRAHVSSAIYEVDPAEIRDLETEHPLGVLWENFDSTVQLVRDWRPDFAFSHLFHFCLEDLGRIFSWEEFRDDWSASPARRSWLWDPAWVVHQKAVDKLVTQRGCTEAQARAAVRNALRWRIGTFYYSFLREIYVVGRLRNLGLPALSHPLADALFRADLWCGDAVVGIYIDNPNYRSTRGGRKHPAQYYLGDQPRFRFIDLEMSAPEGFGTVALPTDDDLNRCVRAIRQSQ